MSNLQNLDLESIEALLQQKQENNPETSDRNEERHSKKKKKHRSKSRSRSRSHKKKSRKRSRSRSKSRKHKEKSRKRSSSRDRHRDGEGSSRSKHRDRDRDGSKRKSKDREGERDRERDRRDDKEIKTRKDDDEDIDLETIERRQNERIQREEEERKKREQKAMEEKMSEAKKQLEEARRDDSTVLMLNLHIRSTERDIYEFFNNNDCGKIRDIRVIRDQKSGKSKGVAYVEFYFLDSVNKAVAQSNKELQGSKVRIMPSKAEINRTAQVAKSMKQTKPNEQQHQAATGGMRLLVSGLTDQLADIEERELRDLFQPFGDVDRIDLHRDDVTGKSKGYAFLLFRNSGDAKRAIIEMDGFKVNDKKIKVEPVQAGMANLMQDNSSFDLDDESGSNYLQTAESRNLLMAKLQRDQGGMPGMEMPVQNVAQEPVAPSKPQTSLLPTNCILMSNMFDVNEVDLEKEPTYFVDLKEEIEEECKKYGDVDQVFIEAAIEGNIWVKFKDGRGASGAYQTLNNKFFSGRKILCSYVTENTFNTKFRSM